MERIQKCGGPDLADVARIQLTLQSSNPERQRVSENADGTEVLAYRTWRITFFRGEGCVTVTKADSGYTPAELADAADPYGDKKIHRSFLGS